MGNTPSTDTGKVQHLDGRTENVEHQRELSFEEGQEVEDEEVSMESPSHEQQELEKNEEGDCGYGMYYYSHDDLAVVEVPGEAPISYPPDDLAPDDSESEHTKDDFVPTGLFGCQRKVMKTDDKDKKQIGHWLPRLSRPFHPCNSPEDTKSVSSFSFDSDEYESPYEPDDGPPLFSHRSHKSESEIRDLLASLLLLQSLPASEDIPSPPRTRSKSMPLTKSKRSLCASSNSSPQSANVEETKVRSRKQTRSRETPITLLPSISSTWGSFSSIASVFNNTEDYTHDEMMMVDGDLPTIDSDLTPRLIHLENNSNDSFLSCKCRSFHVVTTAALPWMTGTAVNPLLRAAYLSQMNRRAVEDVETKNRAIETNTMLSDTSQHNVGTVTLVIPWLIDMNDRNEVYGHDYHFDTPSDQEMYIRNWLQKSAKLPLEADLKSNGIRISFYPARYSKALGSIFALGDICNLIHDADADVCVLEEPEHLNWMRPTDDSIPLWTQKFRFVVGIIHTNYKAYAQAHVSGVVSSPFIGTLSSLMARAHCHKIIKLSACLQTFAPVKEIVSNTHGIRSEFLRRRYQDDQEGPSDSTCRSRGLSSDGIYFLGKLLWAKGLDKMLHLQSVFKKSNGSYFPIDIFGSGPEEIEIKRAFYGREWQKNHSVINLNKHHRADAAIRNKDGFILDLPKSRHELRRIPLPAVFKGRVDHCELHGRYKIFLNPSVTEVLCTTTAEALAMGKFVIIPHHPSNLFFEQFPNCLSYKSDADFIKLLKFARANEPKELSEEQAFALTWEAATERFVTASVITRRNCQKWNRLGLGRADEKAADFLRVALAGSKGDLIRTLIGGRVIGEQYQYINARAAGVEIEKELLE